MRYAHEEAETRFSATRKLSCGPPAFEGDHPGPLNLAGPHCRDRIQGQTPQNWQEIGIVPDKYDDGLAWMVSSKLRAAWRLGNQANSYPLRRR